MQEPELSERHASIDLAVGLFRVDTHLQELRSDAVGAG
jgi:hypothetical protein